MLGCQTTNEIWLTVEKNFNNQSSAEVLYFKKQLQNLRMDNMPIREYIAMVKIICDSLAAAGISNAKQDQLERAAG